MSGRLLVFIISLFSILNIQAQDFTVTGKIADASNSIPLEYATVIFNNNQIDNSVGGVSDKNGEFKLDIPIGTYTVTIEFLSFESKTISDFIVDKDSSLGLILLKPNVESLEAVQISGETNIVSYELGKKVYSVEKDIAAQGTTATDILGNAPSVSMTNGVPMIRGTAATILINGRISAMTKLEALQNLQASSIKSIEVITTPNSRYNANTSGGIINIILKKGVDNGWNGSVTGSAGIKNIYGGAATLNYKKDKVSIYSNTSYFHRELTSKTTIENEYLTTPKNFLTEDRENVRNTNVFNTRVGLDYYLNDNITLNIEGSYAKYNGGFNRTNNYSFTDNNQQLSSAYDQNTYTDHLDDIYEFSAYYDQYFEREGENLFINITYSKDKEINDSELSFEELFPNQMPLPDSDELIYDDLDLENTSWNAYYVFPTSDNSTLDFGSSGEFGNLTTVFDNQIIENGDFVTDPQTSYTFEYKENWFGLYAQFIKESEKFAYLIGLRTETTSLDSHLLTTNQKNSQNYTDFFPSLQVEYYFNDVNTLAFSYNRGIVRANYPNLNPFELRVSETTSFVGNPDLLPFYANQFELSFLKDSEKKFTLNPTLYFRNYDDIWQYITVETGELVNGVSKLITTPINLGDLNFLGTELLANYTISEAIELNGSVDIRYVSQKGIYEYIDSQNQTIILDYNNDNFGGNAKLGVNAEFGKGFHFQSQFNYYLTSVGAYSKRYDFAYLNASISKDLFNEAGSISLAANDIFNSNKTKRLRWGDTFNSLSNSQWRNPTLVATFTYRFNQSKKKRAINIHENDEEEKY